MHPEIRDAMVLIAERDLALLADCGGALLMRPPYDDMHEEEQLRDLFQGQVGTNTPICAVVVLAPPAGGNKPVRIPLSHIETLKWSISGEAYKRLSI